MRSLPPAEQVVDSEYDLKGLQVPTLSGVSLRLYTWLSESWLYGSLHTTLARSSNVPQVLSELQVPEEPLYKPSLRTSEPLPLQLTALGGGTAAQIAALAVQVLGGVEDQAATGDFRPVSVGDYYNAYSTGQCTPSECMERIIAFVAEVEGHSHPPRKFFVALDPAHIRQQAAESTQRWRRGAPLSPLDGVPFAVKDCLDALPYPTTAGTAFLGSRRKVEGDMPAVAALKAAGAILLGKTTLHEIGLGITGLNLATGTPYNPVAPSHYPGGSSSGSAAVVASGICPFAIGTDGGGSIRLPASNCGLVGLKPTYGRLAKGGLVHLDYSVATAGPIAGTVRDCALMYALVAADGGSCPAAELPSPLLAVPAPGKLALEGVSVGVYWAWFEDADSQLVEACRSAVERLQAAGAKVEGCCIPELELIRVAHTVTIVTEMRSAMLPHLADPAARTAINLDVRCSLAAARHFTAADYIQAQKLRRRGEVHFERVLSRHHLIITPTTVSPAPKIPGGALTGGDFNLARAGEAMRFLTPANLLGLPGVSVPVGYTSEGLPIGLQLLGRAWSEALLLRVAAHVEADLPSAGTMLRRPAIHLNPLKAGERVVAIGAVTGAQMEGTV